MVHDVDIVHVPEQAVAVLRGRSPLADIGTRMRHLRELVAGAGLTPAEPMTARFYDTPEAAIPDYAVCLRLEGGQEPKLEWVTEAFARITGYVPDELLAQGGGAGVTPTGTGSSYTTQATKAAQFYRMVK